MAYRGGRKRGAAKSPTVQVGPPNGSNTASMRTTPRHGRNPQSPPPRNPPTNTRPNLSDQREPQPRPQVENNPTRTQPARQTTRKTSPPPQKRTATHKPPTNQQPPPPNRGTTRTKTHSPPSRWGGELRRGLRGTAPHTPHHPPTRNRDPPAEHHHPPDTPAQKPNPSQKPNPKAKTPTTLRPPHHPHPTRYPAHMPWSTSDRRQRLPTNWNKIRKQVLAKAKHKCAGLDPVTTPPPPSREVVEGYHRWHHPACDMRATDVDHIIAGDNHELSNLQALSHACHTAKTTHENTAAKARIRATATRERPPHPCARTTKTNKKEKQNKTKAKTNESETRTETTLRETWN